MLGMLGNTLEEQVIMNYFQVYQRKKEFYIRGVIA